MNLLINFNFNEFSNDHKQNLIKLKELLKILQQSKNNFLFLNKNNFMKGKNNNFQNKIEKKIQINSYWDELNCFFQPFPSSEKLFKIFPNENFSINNNIIPLNENWRNNLNKIIEKNSNSQIKKIPTDINKIKNYFDFSIESINFNNSLIYHRLLSSFIETDLILKSLKKKSLFLKKNITLPIIENDNYLSLNFLEKLNLELISLNLISININSNLNSNINSIYLESCKELNINFMNEIFKFKNILLNLLKKKM